MDEELKATQEEREPRLYELGFHVIPTVAEESVGEEVAALKDIINSHNATVEAEGAPQYVELAYPIEYRKPGESKQFQTAYFGWMQFTATPDAVEKIKRAVEQRVSILRFLLVLSDEVAEPQPAGKAAYEQEDTPVTAGVLSGGVDTAKSSSGPEKETPAAVSEEELDKTIEELTS